MQERISTKLYPQESISPDGESTAPPSDRSDRSSGQLTSEGRGSGVLQGGTGGHSSEVGGVAIIVTMFAKFPI